MSNYLQMSFLLLSSKKKTHRRNDFHSLNLIFRTSVMIQIVRSEPKTIAELN